MTLEEALESHVSFKEAKAEILKHGYRQSEVRQHKTTGDLIVNQGTYLDDDQCEVIAKCTKSGEYRGSDVLGWLGY